MKVSYSEGVAIHTGSESCTCDGNGASEALTGVRAGEVLSREIEPPAPKRWPLLGADAVELSGRQNWKRRNRETLLDLARSKTPSMHASTLSGSRESPWLSGTEGVTDRIGKSKDAPR
jgi:RNA-directed DNA polymerase